MFDQKSPYSIKRALIPSDEPCILSKAPCISRENSLICPGGDFYVGLSKRERTREGQAHAHIHIHAHPRTYTHSCSLSLSPSLTHAQTHKQTHTDIHPNASFELLLMSNRPFGQSPVYIYVYVCIQVCVGKKERDSARANSMNGHAGCLSLPFPHKLVYTHTFIYTHEWPRRLSLSSFPTHTCIHTYIYIHTHTCTHTHTHTHSHTFAHIHTHSHTITPIHIAFGIAKIAKCVCV